MPRAAPGVRRIKQRRSRVRIMTATRRARKCVTHTHKLIQTQMPVAA
jgi:translation initiation factor 1 (eIF-1/SUI1)